MKKILVAVDGSPFAQRALQMACQTAADMKAELTILTVGGLTIEPALDELARIEHATPGDISEQQSQAILAQAKESTVLFGLPKVKTEWTDGDPATAILGLANNLPADLVFVGKRGRGRLEGLLLGSVSQKLVTLATCPITVVP